MIEWDEEPDFCEQVNLGVAESKTKWVSILEFDDEFSKIWFKNVEKFSSHYSDVDCFLPIVVDVDEKGLFVAGSQPAPSSRSFL